MGKNNLMAFDESHFLTLINYLGETIERDHYIWYT